MRDEKFADLLDEINLKKSHTSYAIILALISGIIGLCVTYAFGVVGAYALLLMLPAWGNRGNGSTVTSEGQCFSTTWTVRPLQHKALTRAFDNLMACAGKWQSQPEAPFKTLNVETDAGAARIVSKSPTTLSYSAPSFMAANITPPSVQVGRQTVYFFPDALFIIGGKRVGAINYRAKS